MRPLSPQLRRLWCCRFATVSSPYHNVSSLPPLSLLPPQPTSSHIHQVHGQLILLGHATSCAALGHLLAACAASTSFVPPLSYTCAVFHRIYLPNVFAYNNFIRCLVRAGDSRGSITAYKAMRQTGPPTNNFTYPFVLEACGKGPAFAPEGLQVHGHVVRLGHDGDVFVRNALTHFYCICRRLDDARRVFDEKPDRRDVVSWNVMMAGYAKYKMVSDCADLFEMMPQRDEVSWSTMILAHVQAGMLEKSLDLFREMTRKGVSANESTLVTVLSATAHLGLLEHGVYVHSVMKSANSPVTVTIGTALVEMYARCGCIPMAKQVFDSMPRKDIFTWNSMICGLATHGLATEALKLFAEFTEKGYTPNKVTYVGVLSGCSRAGLVAEGRRHFDAMASVHGIEPEMEHYGCMVDLLGRVGLVAEAYRMVETMKTTPDPVIWGMLLGACELHGFVDLGVEIGNKLIAVEHAHDAHYVLLSSIYAKAQKWDGVAAVRTLMSRRGTSKLVGSSVMEAEVGAVA